MPPQRKKHKPDPYIAGIIKAGKEADARREAAKLKWPKLDLDTAYADLRPLNFLFASFHSSKRAISWMRWYQRKLKSKKGTRERKIAHYLELYYHRKCDIGFGERNPLTTKQKRGIRWAQQQLKASA